MVTVFVTIQVENFLEWERLFDENEELRKEIGVKVINVYLSVDDAEYITIVAEAKDRESFDNYLFNDPKIKEILANYCFKSEPIVRYYNKFK